MIVVFLFKVINYITIYNINCTLLSSFITYEFEQIEISTQISIKIENNKYNDFRQHKLCGVQIH